MLPRRDRAALAHAFAASGVSWTDAAVAQFAVQQGLSVAECKTLWPRGARSVAWDLNKSADRAMQRRWRGETPGLREIVLHRFADNAALKRSIGTLARSDSMHPCNTLARTAETARRMILCAGGYRSAPPLGHFLERWLLVFAYSFCVLVWLADDRADQRATRRAVTLLIGAR
ncbi:hypothetical protein [Terricaulis sp.]|uniref:hypothetical protein n=1 Tax=Terricaulis sp. TaxID=2768686 RepID=UPI003784E07F